ncbi:cytochrome P450 [Nocardia terpenica]|uniref:Cytochrome P450 n=1 Tax=Nocardia terpenica TaxID=455432 RepID=A0A6G9YYX8_9NOCA|nr:cytochrome P450 [Nocardia terpenica]QIS18327.1 cytochrome P450 [Nocardia terpenica]
MSLRTIPFATGAVPGLGHLIPLLRDPFGFLTGLSEQGDLVRIKVGPATLVVVCDPELTRQVQREDGTFDKGGPISEWNRRLLGDGLFTCPHAIHRSQRRQLQPVFHRDHISGYMDEVAARIAELTGSWRDGQILDVASETRKLTSSVVVSTLFSGALPPGVVQQALRDGDEFLNTPVQLLTLSEFKLPVLHNRRRRQAQERLRQVSTVAVREYHAREHGREDLLSTLIAGGDGVSAEWISDNLLTFFLAGAETTSLALAWALHHLTQAPDVAERLRAEVDEVLADHAVGPADLPRLSMAKRVISETLRLRPPGWVASRSVTTDTRLGGHLLPAGTSVVISPYLIHRRGDLYPDPERFDPDRWLQARTAASTSFIPFGSGARKCIADNFALAEAALALAGIIRQWHLVPAPGTRVRAVPAGTLRTRGLLMRATAR